MKEETDRTGSTLKAGLHLGLDCGLRAICPVSMGMTYNWKTRPPTPTPMEEPQVSYLGSPSPKRNCNYLCNQIESYILLCLLGYDHRPIDNNYLGVKHMNHGLIWLSFFSFVQTSVKEFGEVSWARTLKAYKVFTKTGLGPWLRGDSALGPPV